MGVGEKAEPAHMKADDEIWLREMREKRSGKSEEDGSGKSAVASGLRARVENYRD